MSRQAERNAPHARPRAEKPEVVRAAGRAEAEAHAGCGEPREAEGDEQQREQVAEHGGGERREGAQLFPAQQPKPRPPGFRERAARQHERREAGQVEEDERAQARDQRAEEEVQRRALAQEVEDELRHPNRLQGAAEQREDGERHRGQHEQHREAPWREQRGRALRRADGEGAQRQALAAVARLAVEHERRKLEADEQPQGEQHSHEREHGGQAAEHPAQVFLPQKALPREARQGGEDGVHGGVEHGRAQGPVEHFKQQQHAAVLHQGRQHDARAGPPAPLGHGKALLSSRKAKRRGLLLILLVKIGL